MRPFSFLLFFVVAVAMTAGLYLTIRKPRTGRSTPPSCSACLGQLHNAIGS